MTGERVEAARWIARAREACEAIADPADREVIEGDLATIPRQAARRPGVEVQPD